jgi:hypothetical protein
MPRSLFLTIAGVVGLVIGLLALLLPSVILTGKGVTLDAATPIWVREVGVGILALSVIVLLVRRHADTPTLRAVLWGNALVHGALLPIEIVAWRDGVITRLDGIVPNSILHVVFAAGFIFFARIRNVAHAAPPKSPA